MLRPRAPWAPGTDKLRRCCMAQHGAAVLGVMAKATIKEVDKAGFVTKTLLRSKLWEVQTPQVRAACGLSSTAHAMRPAPLQLGTPLAWHHLSFSFLALTLGPSNLPSPAPGHPDIIVA